MNKLNDISKKWLTDNYGDLEKFESKSFSGYIFYMKDGNLILNYNRNNGYCYITHDEIWSFLKSVFQLEYGEIQAITKEWVEEHYKLEVTTTFTDKTKTLRRWRNITNWGVTTTHGT